MNLPEVQFYENNPDGSVLFNYTNFPQNSNISSVTIQSPNDKYFFVDLTRFQLISLIKFDREFQTIYNLNLSVVCEFRITEMYEQIVLIKDLNDNRATWTFSNLTNYYIGYIKDNSNIKTNVSFQIQPKFTDADSRFHFEVILSDNSTFEVSPFYKHPSTVYIRNSKLLNYDHKKEYNFTMILKDMDFNTTTVVFVSEVTVIIHVVDTDNKLPIFEKSLYSFEICTNASNNSVFNVSPIPLRAYDGDLAMNNTILYKFVNEIEYLNLEPSTGILRTNHITLNATEIQTSIIAFQMNDANQKSTVDVIIKIIQCFFRFMQKIVYVDIDENQTRSLIQLNFSVKEKTNITFSMLPEIQNFKINQSGLIMVVKGLNYTIQKNYNFTIIATDGRTLNQMIVVVNVIEVKMYIPRFSEPTYHFYGNIRHLTCLGNVKVLDVNPSITIQFRLKNNYGIFQIDSSKGSICVIPKNISIIEQKKYALIAYLVISNQSQPLISVNVIADFSIPKKRIIDKEGYLTICILVPIIIILISIYPILMCYYKRCQNSESHSNENDKRLTNEYRVSFNRGFEISECDENMQESFYMCDNKTFDVQQEDISEWNKFTSSSSQKRKVTKQPLYIQNLEIMEIRCDGEDKAQFNNSNSAQLVNGSDFDQIKL